MGVHGAPGQPDATLEEDGGAPKRGRGVQQHATSSMLFESYPVNTGEPVVYPTTADNYFAPKTG